MFHTVFYCSFDVGVLTVVLVVVVAVVVVVLLLLAFSPKNPLNPRNLKPSTGRSVQGPDLHQGIPGVHNPRDPR